MKHLITMAMLLVLVATSNAQEQKVNPSQQLKIAAAEINRLNTLLSDSKADRNAAIVEVARLREALELQRKGIIKSEKILQKGIDNDIKIDFKALVLAGWDLVLPDSTAKKPDSNKLPD